MEDIIYLRPPPRVSLNFCESPKSLVEYAALAVNDDSSGAYDSLKVMGTPEISDIFPVEIRELLPFRPECFRKHGPLFGQIPGVKIGKTIRRVFVDDVEYLVPYQLKPDPELADPGGLAGSSDGQDEDDTGSVYSDVDTYDYPATFAYENCWFKEVLELFAGTASV